MAACGGGASEEAACWNANKAAMQASARVQSRKISEIDYF